MLRFSRGAPADGETPVAVVRGGPWAGGVVTMGSPDFVEETPELEWFEGLAAPDGSEFSPLPCTAPEQRDVVFISGPSGVGKSTAAADMASNFVEVFSRPGKQALVVIVCPDDPNRDRAFRDAGFKWTWVSPESLVATAAPLELFEGGDGDPGLVIFDDVEALQDKAQAAAVEALSKAVLERGRKRAIYAYYIAHRPAAGKATKVILQEQNACWFPTSGCGSGNLAYMMEKHLGIPAELKTALKKNQREFGRWALVKTDAQPRYVITPKRTFTIDEDEIADTVRAERRASMAAARAESMRVPDTDGLAALASRRGGGAALSGDRQAPDARRGRTSRGSRSSTDL